MERPADIGSASNAIVQNVTAQVGTCWSLARIRLAQFDRCGGPNALHSALLDSAQS